MTFRPPFGIDLGTTQSAAAIFGPGDPSPLLAADPQGELTLPSLLRQTDDGRWQVGRQARDASDDTPLLSSVKRYIGRQKALPQTDAIDATEASAILLASLAASMQSLLDQSDCPLSCEANRAVITVPAYFDAPQIEATRRAGHLAGLDVVGLLQEPTAAAIYHCWNEQLGDGTYLVYDLGGGTFDVTILRSLFGEYQVLSIAGDNHLGGDDFDRRLAHILRAHLIDGGADLRESLDDPRDVEAFGVLQHLARQAKEALTDSDSTRLHHPDLLTDRSGHAVDLDIDLHRRDLLDCIDDLLDATLQSCDQALDVAQHRHDLAPKDIDAIFLVGGSTRMPAVRKTLLQHLAPRFQVDEAQIFGDHPQTAVARGAALHSAAVAPLHFSNDATTIAITDLPGDQDSLLMGHLLQTPDPTPQSCALHYVGDADPIARTDLDLSASPPRFAFPDLPSNFGQSADTSHVEAHLHARGGPDRDPIDLWLPRRPSDAPPAPTLTLSNPAVVAKDITLEVHDDGRPRRHILVPQGTHLPTRTETTLRVGDDAEAVILRLFQHHLPIKTVVLDRRPDLAPGAPIKLVIDIDQSMHLQAFGRLGDSEFSLPIDRPTPPTSLDWEAIETLIEDSADLDAHLWGAEARRYRRRRQNLIAGLEAALSQDPDRLQVLARRLQRLLHEYRPRPGRTPGRSRLLALLDRIRRLVFARPTPPLDKSLDQWRQHLDDLRLQLDRAWSADDDAPWRDVADRIQATFESIAQDEALFQRRDPQRHATMLGDSARLRLDDLQRRLRSFPLSDHPRARQLQKHRIQDLDEASKQLRQRLHNLSSPPQLQKLHHAIDHLDDRFSALFTLGLPNPGEPS